MLRITNKPEPRYVPSKDVFHITVYGDTKSLGRNTAPDYDQKLQAAYDTWNAETLRREKANLQEKEESAKKAALQSSESRSTLTLWEVQQSGRCTIKELAHLFKADKIRQKGEETTELKKQLKAFEYLYLAQEAQGDLNVNCVTSGLLQHCRENVIIPSMTANRPNVKVSTVNKKVKMILTVFRFGKRHNLLRADAMEDLASIVHLNESRPEYHHETSVLKASERVQPVDDVLFWQTVDHDDLSPMLRDMLLVQYYAGCRPEDVCRMRGAAINRDDPECWLYVPSEVINGKPFSTHKNDHKMKNRLLPQALDDPNCRIIGIAGDAQTILQPYLEQLPNHEQYLFSSTRERKRFHQDRTANRVSDPRHGNRPKGNNEFADTDFDHSYSSSSYAEKLSRFLKRNELQHWSPNQIRHKGATDIATNALKQAQNLLGHSNHQMTTNYTSINVAKAKASAIAHASNITLGSGS